MNRRAVLFSVAALVALLIGGAGALVGLYIDWLWFDSVGYLFVFQTMLTARVLLFVAGTLLFWIILLPNVLLALRFALRSVERLPIRVLQNEAVEQLLGGPAQVQPLVRLAGQVVLLGGLLVGIVLGLGAAAQWPAALRFLNATSFGASDPIFGEDLGFYIFQLPVIRSAVNWLLAAVALVGAGVLAIYAIALYLADPSLQHLRFMLLGRGRSARAHVMILLAVLALILAAIVWFQGYDVLYRTRDQFFGAGYTDVFFRLPALRVMAGSFVLLAVLILASIPRVDYVLPLGGLVITALVLVIGLVVLPAFIQRVRVDPAELAREAPFIANSIRLTRLGFALDRIEERTFAANEMVQASEIGSAQQTVANVRLWDPRPLRDTYNQIQAIRLYYSFDDVDVDRYEIDGTIRQVMIGARELDPDRLPAQAATWQNRHLQFTHGYGAVMSPVNEVTPEGLPQLLLKDIPPEGVLPLGRPEIYYGMQTHRYVAVRTGEQEFDYPRGDENVYTTYEGQNGIRIGSVFRRLLLAWHLRELNMLTSPHLRDDSLLLMRRNVPERVRRIAPFLQLDRDPYLVAADGRLVWIIDAYTTTDRIPYAQPVTEIIAENMALQPTDGQAAGESREPQPTVPPGVRVPRRGRSLNYIRNSVKVVVDAYGGTVTLYAAEPDEPLLRTQQRIYPGLVRPLTEMPESLRKHIRYPEDLFRVQAEVFLTYHMRDPQVFYNREDQWQVARESFADQRVLVEPYYVIMRLPGEPEEEFLLMLPFTPAAKDNMIAWLAARSDGQNYGTLLLYKFPKERLIFGPMQIEARIDQNPEISAQLTLWNQGGSRVIRGNLLVIPVGNSTLYVEPVYLQAEQSRLPELKRVVVATGNRLVMEPTLDAALVQIFGESVVAGLRPSVGAAATPAAGQALAGTAVSELAAQARQHYEQAQQALRDGQWAEFGKQLEALGRVLSALDQSQ